MNYVNDLPVENLRTNIYQSNYTSIGDKFEGFKNKVLINYNTEKVDSYEITYLDIEKSDFIKAIINGEGDLWEGEFSSKGQRVLGDYIIHIDSHIEPNPTAKFVVDKFMYLTVIVDILDNGRQIITHYDGDFTEKFEDVPYIELQDNRNILIDTINIEKLYVIPAIIPEDYAETLQNSELVAPPYFKINDSLYTGRVQDLGIEALGRGESFRIEGRKVENI